MLRYLKFESIFRAALLLLAGCWLVDARVSEAQQRLDDLMAANQEDAMHIDRRSENEIVLARKFRADRETVFAALTQANHLVNWMQPSNMALVACEVDLRVGGSFRYVFRRPGGTELEVRGTYEAVDAPARFTYTETYDFSPLEVLVRTVLEIADEATLFKQTLSYPSKQQRDDDFDGVATSAREAYAKLDRYLAQIGQ